ncbi:MAG TPA: hypothetical protein VKA46_07790 [Gemmataceae bacterium]|nr:hypothetical protein [Gemmataceae bacterium]
MTALEPVILVRELPPARSQMRQQFPSLRELVEATPAPEEPAILSYLAQGVVCGIYNDPALLVDVLQPGRWLDAACEHDPRLSGLALQPSLMLTDGAWVWPGVLPYYVAAYHLRLPRRFVQFAEGHQWKVDPSAIRPEDVNWDAYDAILDLAVTAGR